MNNLLKYAQKSAEVFYRYATENNASNAKYGVSSILANGPFFDLILETALSSIDGMHLQIGETVYGEEKFKPTTLDPKTKTVRVLPADGMEEILLHANPAEVYFVYDLRFLITRVAEWYKEYGELIRLPECAPQIHLYLSGNATPSSEQKCAVETILSRPLTYIWGAPGTGKTQYVLSQCLLSYIKAEKLVLIAAPTNRAVEQMLYGILPILEAEGIDQEAVLRLGTPTKEFAARYPKVCENGSLWAKIEELNASVALLKTELKENAQKIKHFDRFSQYLASREDFENAVEQIEPALRQFSAAAAELPKAQTEIDATCGILLEYRSQKDSLDRRISSLRSEIAARKKKSEKYSAPLIRTLLAKKAEQNRLQLSNTVNMLESCCANKEKLQQKIQEATQEKERHQIALDQLEQQSSSARTQLQNNSAIFIKLHLLPNRFDFSELPAAIQKGQELFRRKEQEYAGFSNSDLSALRTERQKLEEQLQECKKMIADLKKEDRRRTDQLRVVAATIDGCLARALPDGDYRPEHVFLDEAGYASLIKAAPLTAFHCPLTLLGDHMQLPPVCEINDDRIKEEKYETIALWAQSALYLEDLFAEDFPALHQRYLDHAPPHFNVMQKCDLTRSFRFGKELAAVLAGDVYSKTLEGSETHQTEIFYINAPAHSLPGGEKRSSMAECEAIKRYLAIHKEGEIGVITPYNNQKKLLKKSLPSYAEVNTVHGAQGREWDCVILSVTDTTDKWFTNSLSPISNGKKVVNTAVSRAKKRLILVCDAEYWKNQPRQLIGKLLSIAAEITP